MVPDAVQLPLQFDPASLQDALVRAADVGWTDHFVTRNYEGVWSAIALRGPAYATHPIQAIYSDPTCTEFADTAVLDACPYFRTVLDAFACPLESVRLMRLAPGSVILEHTDVELAVEQGHARLHVPVVTNPDVRFTLNGRIVVMREGECWYLRLSDPHAVRNDGSRERVHLVIDAVADRWLREKLAVGAAERR